MIFDTTEALAAHRRLAALPARRYRNACTPDADEVDMRTCRCLICGERDSSLFGPKSATMCRACQSKRSILRRRLSRMRKAGVVVPTEPRSVFDA